MKKLKNILLILIILAMFTPIKVNAEDDLLEDDLPEDARLYYGIRIGSNTANKETEINSRKLYIENKDPFISVNVGIKSQKFRLELEYAYRCNFIDYDGGINVLTTMVNFYYNFLDFNLLKFFANIGIGNTRLSSFSEVEEKENFTWNTGFGVNLSIFDIVDLDIGYRYVDMGDLKVKNGINTVKLSQKAQDIYAGLRFGF